MMALTQAKVLQLSQNETNTAGVLLQTQLVVLL